MKGLGSRLARGNSACARSDDWLDGWMAAGGEGRGGEEGVCVCVGGGGGGYDGEIIGLVLAARGKARRCGQASPSSNANTRSR